MTSGIYHYERVGSTMDLIHQLAERGFAAGTIVVAGEQLEGRGSRGRLWHSPPGGLWLSGLYRPPSAGGVEVLSVRVGLAVARALEPLVPSPLRLKWPNDLMLDERKVGGILCEARWQGAVLGWIAVGVGLNVRNAIPADLRDTAISLAALQPDIQLDAVLQRVAPAIQALDLRAERLTPTELAHFSARSWLNGQEIRQPLSGVVTGLDPDGSLRVRTSAGSDVSLRHGSVELARVSHTR